MWNCVLFMLRKIEGNFKRYFINLFDLDKKKYIMIKNTIVLIKVYIIAFNLFNPLSKKNQE